MRSAPPLAEDVALVAALRADVDRHVLDDAEDRDADLLEHLEALARVDERDVLRRGDDHGAGHRHLLRERELDVAGARRQVDHQVVELAPARVLQQLLQRLRHHRAAPDHRRVDVDQEADRDRLQAVAHHRLEALAVLRFGPPGDAEHHRLRRAVDVGVEDADRGALGGEREREVHRGGALAHAALAGGHGDDVLDARHQLHAALHRVRHDLRAPRSRSTLPTPGLLQRRGHLRAGSARTGSCPDSRARCRAARRRRPP